MQCDLKKIIIVNILYAKLIRVNLDVDRFLRNNVLAGLWQLELGVKISQVVGK